MTDPQTGIAVGDGGALVERSDGAWSSVASPTSKPLKAVWTNPSGNAWVAGWRVVLHQDSEGWAEVTDVPKLDYRAVAGAENGEIVLGAAGGRIVRRLAPQVWAEEPTPFVGDIEAFWFHPEAGFFAITAAGEVGRKEAGGWSLLASPEFELGSLSGITGNQANGQFFLWVVSREGNLFQYSAAGWAPVESDGTTAWQDIAWLSATDTFVAVGSSGLRVGPFVPIPEVNLETGGTDAAWELQFLNTGEFTPEFRFVQVVGSAGFPIWSWMINGTVEQAWLPDLSGGGVWSLLQTSSPLQLRVYSVHNPGFTIHSYTNFELNLLAWDSWSLVIEDLL